MSDIKNIKSNTLLICDNSFGVNVKVHYWKTITHIGNQFIERPRSFLYVWNYYCQVGLMQVVRKIISRLKENSRNNKVAAIGTGYILEADQGSTYQAGDYVLFFATNHSARPSVICVDQKFVIATSELDDKKLSLDGIEVPLGLMGYVGWNPYSGEFAEKANIHDQLNNIIAKIAIFEDEQSGYNHTNLEVVDRIEKNRIHNTKPTAVLFGLGNYAKTQIVPHISKKLNLVCVHEIDPDQLKTANSWDVTLDTSPSPREGEAYDAWFIAGYHHTHAGIAASALKDGAYAVVEKPLATTWPQFSELRDVLTNRQERKLFACFHKRYSIMATWAFEDLGVNSQNNEPVDMHCIVYEIPLPKLHWYNWPNSGSRIVSNGCHWLDYFMFFNNYRAVTKHELSLASNGNYIISVELENKANMNMVLTEIGSERLGVRDVIELRSGNTTIRMVDSTTYSAENSIRVSRSKKINPMNAYQRMYSSICKQILVGAQGDSLASLRSTELMLKLEDQYKRIMQTNGENNR